MTREEAKQWLEAMKSSYALPTETYEALDMAIEALKQVTGKLNNPDDSLLTADSEACKEQKSKLDLISRAEAIEAVRLETAKRLLLGRGDILDILYALPSADRPRGRWHYSNGKPATIGQSFGVICDQCGTESEYCTNFCGDCGADMRETKGVEE